MYVHRSPPIGKGGFGEVFDCEHTVTGIHYAVKRSDIDEYGIRNMNELAIMTSFRHPHIMHMIHSYFEDGKVCAVMPKGVSDFSKLCRISKGGTPMSLDQVKIYGWQIATAISYLHSQDIVHVDVKLNNVIMVDGVAVLSDFGLSLRKDTRTEFNYNIGTPTHRPPEMWNGNLWNESIDIWGFGCAMYEMVFGELPIPEQKNINNSANEKKKYLNCIQHFCAGFPIPCRSYDISRNSDAVSIALPSTKILQALSDPKYLVICDLISKMMHYDPRRRFKISEVMGHPFFTGSIMPQAHYLTLPIKNTDNILSELSAYTASEGTIILANQIYSKTSPSIIARNKPLYVAACFVIACKLRNIPHHKLESKCSSATPAAIRAAEINIVLDLRFKLYDAK